MFGCLGVGWSHVLWLIQVPLAFDDGALALGGSTPLPLLWKDGSASWRALLFVNKTWATL